MQRTTRVKRGQHFGRRAQREGLTTTRQPRPAPRRQGTRSGILAAAVREG